MNQTEMTILDNLLEGYQIIDFNFRYVYVNNAVVKQSKYASKEELIGFTMMEKYPGIENTQFFNVLQQCMKKRASAMLDNEFTFPDGSIGWFELRIHPVGQGISILSLDITERKKMEKEREDKLGELEAIMFMTSHQLRGPVASIIGLSNALSAENLHEGENKAVGFIKTSALILDKVSKDLGQFVHNLKQKANRKNWA